MNNTKKWAELISETIKKRDLYGRSFTAGVALFILASEGWLDEEMGDELEEELHVWIGDDLIAEMQNRGLSVWYRNIVHIIDLAVLDEIARRLEGEEDEE